MKNLITYITEKFLIDNGFKEDFSPSIHKYTVGEMLNLFDSHLDYKINLIMTNRKNVNTTLDDHYLFKGDNSSELLNALDPKTKTKLDDMYKKYEWRGPADNQVKATTNNLINHGKATNIICIEKFSSKYNNITANNLKAEADNYNKDKDVYRIGLFILNGEDNKKYYDELFQYNTSGLTVVYNVETDDDAKEITLYLCLENNYNTLASKNSTNYRDIDKNASENYFDKNNEDKLQQKVTNKDILLSDIPDSFKYRGKSKASLFWKVYVTLAIYGPMKKPDVLEVINKLTGSDMVLTSYATMFAQWSKDKKIVSNKGLLTPQPYSDWKK